MSRDYARIYPSFWTGETGRTLRKAGPEAQLVALYLLTCPSANMIGLYYLPIPTMAHELGMTEEVALRGIQCVTEAGIAYYDALSEYVFVPMMARWQVGESLKPNDLKEVEKHRRSIYFQDFLELYGEAYHIKDTKPLRSPELLEQRGGELRREGNVSLPQKNGFWTDQNGQCWKIPTVKGRLKPGKCPGHKALREYVLQRDKYCRHCGTTMNLVADHIISRKRGGTHHPDNLQALCQPCNSRKACFLEDAGGKRNLSDKNNKKL